MRGKLKRVVLWGGVIGFCSGLLAFLLLPIMNSRVPGLYQIAEIPGKMAEPLTELGIRLMCGKSPNIGCASGLGMLIFLVLWPLCFCILWTLLGAISGLIFLILYRLLDAMFQKKRLR